LPLKFNSTLQSLKIGWNLELKTPVFPKRAECRGRKEPAVT
jgi:hypothetical protein